MVAHGFPCMACPVTGGRFGQGPARGRVQRQMGSDAQEYACPGIVGRSGSMVKLARLIARVAASHANVLIEGESGTGKELVARAIHQGSPRQGAPFIGENCAALSESLIE